MGQNSSRAAPAAGPSTSFAPHDTEPAPPRRSRRESVRRSILNLVKPHERVDNSIGRSRRSWRSSRRWSKAPLEHPPPAEPSSDSAASLTAPPSPVTEKGKGIQRDSDADTDALSLGDGSDRPTSSSPHASTDAAGDVSEHTPVDSNETQDESTPTPEDHDEVVISPDTEPQAETPQDEPPDRPAPSTTPPPTHQFPPPGTLVVVQGVVHTTDVPRPSAPPSTTHLEAPDPAPRSSSTPPTARNRLSSLLPSRPASILGSRPASTSGILPSSSTTLDATPTSASEEAEGDSVPSHTDLPATDFPLPSTSRVPSAHAPNDAPSGTISPGSIDVLGTLLSVAAAATAASLLTGTSQPLLLPSSLAPPAYSSTSNSTASPTQPSPADTTALSGTDFGSASRPTSPTPTAGLGLDAPRAERLRQAWGSIRERLGLRPTPGASSSSTSASTEANANASNMASPSGTDTASTLNPSPTADVGVGTDAADPREQLFGQMARAFNLGLGLATDSATPPSASSAPSSGAGTGAGTDDAENANAESSGHVPAEGSFERFLIDLQADLRVALTSVDGHPDADADAAAPAVTSLNTNASGGAGAEADHTRGAGASSFAVPGEEMVEDREELEGDLDDDDDDSMPPLREVSDSESDSDFEDAHEGLDTSAREPYLDQRGQDTGDANAGPGAAQAPTPEIDAQGRINWWRLYRFAPIAMPSTQGVPAGPAAPLPPFIGANPTSTSSDSTSSSLSPLPVVTDPTLSELPFAQHDNPSTREVPPPPLIHTVVPVIVVGVQSVAATWHLHPRTTGEDGPALGVEDPTATPTASTTPQDNSRTPTPAPRGGRGWHSRAAEAIRSLRPGRRTHNATAATGPGSRTFLIYVIGGYYPPNHTILNGGPDTLASLEALLELADLLGHAKPATATKEEIEKSGLELIKSAQLEQYEREERISSNCTERCLICLDDYQPEDDIRVMKCRHAFHQNCVDKWLETGRNNCPACRSKGVAVDGMPEV